MAASAASSSPNPKGLITGNAGGSTLFCNYQFADDGALNLISASFWSVFWIYFSAHMGRVDARTDSRRSFKDRSVRNLVSLLSRELESE
jgi:hypothetical protein